MHKNQGGFVYILSNKWNTVLYVGVCENLTKLVYKHKEKVAEGFTQKYNVTKLVYYGSFSTILEAIQREKQLKNWKRLWKIELIKKLNPSFCDLYNDLL